MVNGAWDAGYMENLISGLQFCYRIGFWNLESTENQLAISFFRLS
jgi:hypothetical protein